MTAPALKVQINGGSAVSGDNLNTYMLTCDIASQLRAFIGVQGMEVYLRGQSAVGDGYQGVFWWNYTASSATDDNGITTIVPNGAGIGCWSRLPDVNNNYTYNVPVTGFALTVGNGISSLLLKPAGALSTGTVILPSAPLDGQLFRLSCTQNITTLTVSPNSGQTVNNAPTSLTAGTGFAWQYSIAQLSWFRLY